MAMIKSIEIGGIIINNTYARIGRIVGDKNGITIQLDHYKDRESFEGGIAIVKTTYYDFVPSVENDAKNFIKQGYEHLKTLVEFSDAIDA